VREPALRAVEQPLEQRREVRIGGERGPLVTQPREQPRGVVRRHQPSFSHNTRPAFDQARPVGSFRIRRRRTTKLQGPAR